MKTQLSVFLYLVSFMLSQNTVEGKNKKKIKISVNFDFLKEFNVIIVEWRICVKSPTMKMRQSS